VFVSTLILTKYKFWEIARVTLISLKYADFCSFVSNLYNDVISMSEVMQCLKMCENEGEICIA
jgi:hypothetical protein